MECRADAGTLTTLATLALRLGDEEIKTELVRELGRDELSADAVPGGVEAGRERADPSLARSDRDDAASDAAFPR